MSSFDENNYEPLSEEGEDLPEESSNNRTFMIAVGILGGLILISVACLGAMALFNSRSANTNNQAALSANATQTEVAKQKTISDALTATFQAAQPTMTLSPTVTATPLLAQPSPTSAIDPAVPTATNAGGLSDAQLAATATVGAAFTQAAAVQLTVTAIPSPTQLASTGFADEYGLPGLVVMALAFVIVILFARRLRSSPAL